MGGALLGFPLSTREDDADADVKGGARKKKNDEGRLRFAAEMDLAGSKKEESSGRSNSDSVQPLLFLAPSDRPQYGWR